MTLVQKDAGTSPARRSNGMPVTVDPMPWMAIPGIALLVIGMLLGAYGHRLDPAGTGELAVLQWFQGRRTGFLTSSPGGSSLSTGRRWCRGCCSACWFCCSHCAGSSWR